MEELIPTVLKKWAKPMEFDGEGMEIKVINFEVLTLEAITERDGRAPLFPPKDGKVRRLTFENKGFEGNRTLDINSPRFQNDLSKHGIKKGDVGILNRTKEGMGFIWSWEHVIVTDLK